jgi:hypothetical protein
MVLESSMTSTLRRGGAVVSGMETPGARPWAPAVLTRWFSSV